MYGCCGSSPHIPNKQQKNESRAVCFVTHQYFLPRTESSFVRLFYIWTKNQFVKMEIFVKAEKMWYYWLKIKNIFRKNAKNLIF